MFGLGTTELIVIMVICIILFGAKRLPDIGAGLGRGIKNFKASLKEMKKEEEDVEASVSEDEAKAIKENQ